MPDDPNATQPPVNTPRKAFAWLYAEAKVHTVIATGLGCLVAGFILGKL